MREGEREREREREKESEREREREVGKRRPPLRHSLGRKRERERFY